jgi:hypothetical protein
MMARHVLRSRHSEGRSTDCAQAEPEKRESIGVSLCVARRSLRVTPTLSEVIFRPALICWPEKNGKSRTLKPTPPLLERRE